MVCDRFEYDLWWFRGVCEQTQSLDPCSLLNVVVASTACL